MLVVGGSLMIAITYYYQAHWGIIVAGAGVFVVGTLMFYTLPAVFKPEGFAVPLNPILPCLGTLANLFLLGERGGRVEGGRAEGREGGRGGASLIDHWDHPLGGSYYAGA
jgi:hypothetical protein